MHFYRSIYNISLILFLCSCQAIKINKALNGDSETISPVVEELHFEYENGIMVIPVMVNGKELRLAVDTGAPTVLKTSVKEALGLSSHGIFESGGVQDDSKAELDIIEIDTISIGNISLKNMGAFSNDLNSGTLKCLGFDGLLGANFMKEFYWLFDFKNQIIRISNQKSLLIDENDDYKKIKLYIGYAGIPSITSFLNGKQVNNTVLDLGYYGSLNFSNKAYPKVIKSEVSSFISGTGLVNDGLNSTIKEFDPFYSGNIKEYKAGNFIANNAQISFTKGEDDLIGLGLLKNYKLFMDWKDKEARIYDYNNTEISYPEKYNDFGFGFVNRDEELIISYLIDESVAIKSGLKIGDRIISANNSSYENASIEFLCSVSSNSFKELKELNLKVLREGDLHEINMKIQ